MTSDNSIKSNMLNRFKLMWTRFAQLRRFALASLLVFSFTFVSTVFFSEFVGLNPELGFTITIALSIIFGFFVCRIFVYRACHGSIVMDFMRYVGAVAIFRGLDLLAFFILVTLLDVWYPLAMAIILPVTAFMKYIALKSVVFKYRGHDLS